MKKTELLALILTLTLGGCASMRDFIYSQAGDTPTAEESDRAPASVEPDHSLDVRKEHYYRAYARWPWADGSQLRRRALIMALDPSEDMLERLDGDREPDLEIRMLAELSRSRSRFSNAN